MPMKRPKTIPRCHLATQAVRQHRQHLRAMPTNRPEMALHRHRAKQAVRQHRQRLRAMPTNRPEMALHRHRAKQAVRRWGGAPDRRPCAARSLKTQAERLPATTGRPPEKPRRHPRHASPGRPGGRRPRGEARGRRYRPRSSEERRVVHPTSWLRPSPRRRWPPAASAPSPRLPRAAAPRAAPRPAEPAPPRPRGSRSRRPRAAGTGRAPRRDAA
ncbi:MAG: hypothetical protein RL653_2906 [Pseudomonadota bacterium]|jgi:hypothetical protein